MCARARPLRRRGTGHRVRRTRRRCRQGRKSRSRDVNSSSVTSMSVKSLDGDRSVDLVCDRGTCRGLSARRDPLMAIGSISILPTRRRLENNVRATVRRARSLVTQPFRRSSYRPSASDNGKEAVQVAAVECIHHTRPRPALRRSRVRRRPTEFVEPRERGVEVCLVEYFAAVDQRRLRTSEG